MLAYAPDCSEHVCVFMAQVSIVKDFLSKIDTEEYYTTASVLALIECYVGNSPLPKSQQVNTECLHKNNDTVLQ